MQDLPNCNYRSLLVPLDGSQSAEHALPIAVSLARRHGAALHVVRVYVPIAGVYGEHAAAHLAYDEGLDRELMKRAADYLESVVTRLASSTGIQASAVLLEGSVADTISRQAGAVGADLLVMTMQGRGPIARFWLGSVSDELVRQAGIPILFVRPLSAAPEFAHDYGLRRVLIPLDGSPLAERVLEPVLAFFGGAQCDYTLLQVYLPTSDLDYGPAGGTITGFQESLKQLNELDQREQKRAYAYLEGLAERLRRASFRVSVRVVAHDRVATAILDDASVHNADVIALATHGRSGLKRLVLGSVADKVIRGCEKAVLVYRPLDDSPRT